MSRRHLWPLGWEGKNPCCGAVQAELGYGMESGCWHRLPGELLESPSLEAFRGPVVQCPWQGWVGVGLGDLGGFPNPQNS